MSLNPAIRASISADLDQTIADYKHFHRTPELSMQETNTAAEIASRLRALGLETHTFGGTGVVAVIENGDGPVIGYRADIDGLPITEDTGAACPVCGAKVVKKKSARGYVYYSCDKYPTCQFMTWDKPLSETCPKCGSTLFQKTGRGALIHCLKEGCDYARPVKPKKEADE